MRTASDNAEAGAHKAIVGDVEQGVVLAVHVRDLRRRKEERVVGEAENEPESLCVLRPPICTSRLCEDGTSSSIFLVVKMSMATKWHLAWPCLPVLEVDTSTTCAYKASTRRHAPYPLQEASECRHLQSPISSCTQRSDPEIISCPRSRDRAPLGASYSGAPRLARAALDNHEPALADAGRGLGVRGRGPGIGGLELGLREEEERSSVCDSDIRCPKHEKAAKSTRLLDLLRGGTGVRHLCYWCCPERAAACGESFPLSRVSRGFFGTWSEEFVSLGKCLLVCTLAVRERR